MEQLVFISADYDEPFTDTTIIAKGTGNEHESVMRLLNTYKKQFAELGQIRFSDLKSGNPLGGRPQRIALLNEPQATFLITLLNNTPDVVAFKLELVKQFYMMRVELARRQIARSERKPIRRNLTDALRDSGEDERMHGHAYSTYTNVIYKTVLGKDANQLRQERAGGQKVNASTLLTAEELEAVAVMENRVCVLLDFGFIYNQIKGMLSKGTQRILTGTRSA